MHWRFKVKGQVTLFHCTSVQHNHLSSRAAQTGKSARGGQQLSGASGSSGRAASAHHPCLQQTVCGPPGRPRAGGHQGAEEASICGRRQAEAEAGRAQVRYKQHRSYWRQWLPSGHEDHSTYTLHASVTGRRLHQNSLPGHQVCLMLLEIGRVQMFTRCWREMRVVCENGTNLLVFCGFTGSVWVWRICA